QLRFTDPGTLHLAGAMTLGSGGSLRDIHLTDFRVTLPSAYQRYGKAWLATLGFANLETRGQVEGSLWMDSHGLRAFKLDAQQVGISGGRVAVQNLDGALDWRRGADRPATRLSWNRLGFYDIVLGPAA